MGEQRRGQGRERRAMTRETPAGKYISALQYSHYCRSTIGGGLDREKLKRVVEYFIVFSPMDMTWLWPTDCGVTGEGFITWENGECEYLGALVLAMVFFSKYPLQGWFNMMSTCFFSCCPRRTPDRPRTPPDDSKTNDTLCSLRCFTKKYPEVFPACWRREYFSVFPIIAWRVGLALFVESFRPGWKCTLHGAPHLLAKGASYRFNL